MHRTIQCAHCRCRFLPDPRVKSQRFCSNKSCQRARKTRWQRDKMTTDPDYRANQRDSQRSWQNQHPQYWHQYRQTRADYRERNRLLQQHRDHKRRIRPLAKRDVLESVTCIQPGIYHLIPAVGPPLGRVIAKMPCHSNDLADLANKDMIDPVGR